MKSLDKSVGKVISRIVGLKRHEREIFVEYETDNIFNPSIYGNSANLYVMQKANFSSLSTTAMDVKKNISGKMPELRNNVRY